MLKTGLNEQEKESLLKYLAANHLWLKWNDDCTKFTIEFMNNGCSIDEYYARLFVRMMDNLRGLYHE